MNILESPTVRALKTLCPGAQWAIIGEDLSTLQWNDLIQSRPTDAAIQAQILAG